MINIPTRRWSRWWMNWPRLANSSKVPLSWFSLITQSHQCQHVQSVRVKIAKSLLLHFFFSASCDVFSLLKHQLQNYSNVVFYLQYGEWWNIWFVSCTELRLRQSVFESKDGELSCSYTSGEQEAPEHQPTLEETVDSLFRRLREKRQTLGLPDNTKVRIKVRTMLLPSGFDT